MDYSALNEHLTNAQVDQFNKKYPLVGSLSRNYVIGYFVLGFMILVFSAGVISAATGESEGGMTSIIALSVFIVLSAGGIVLTALGAKKQRRQAARIQLFAERNRLQYIRSQEAPKYTGMYFNEGSDRIILNALRSQTTSPTYEVGTIQYSVGSGKDKHTYQKGYVRIGLERNLPQIVLDASSNNGKIFGANLTNLPVDYKLSQRMSLEGDFDKHFSLYAPKGYERDALYVFTPDLMALLIDNASAYDAEIIDDQLFIYNAGKPFDLSNEHELARIFEMIRLVGSKASSQTSYYADANVGDRSQNVVATQGQRLKKRISVFTIIIIVIAMAITFGPSIFELIDSIRH